MVMGFFQPGMKGTTPFAMTGARKTVPSMIARIVPLGLFHICFKPYSFTRSALGVMVAHLTATPYFNAARALSRVISSSVSSRFWRPRS